MYTYTYEKPFNYSWYIVASWYNQVDVNIGHSILLNISSDTLIPIFILVVTTNSTNIYIRYYYTM